LFDMMRPKYEEAKKRKLVSAPDEIKRGVGISLACYGAGFDTADGGDAAVELLADGSVLLSATFEDHGQGGDMGALAFAHESLKELKLRPDQIKLVLNDMRKNPNSGPAGGSRGAPVIGSMIFEACDKLVKAMKKSNGTFRTYDEMIKEGIAVNYVGSYSTAPFCDPPDQKAGQYSPYSQYMYAVYLSEVEVDVKTGKVTVVKVTSAYDVGVIGNRQVVEGQAYGGWNQGIGCALTEDFEDLKTHTTMAKCGFPTIKDIPDDIELMFLETPRKNTSHGQSGCGEIVVTAPHVAILNAIDDACGARVRALPATPGKVLAALKK
jgi:aldehyde oxidoreductase